jgi:MinD-like ATPase involved in chromosome partitioning or flagellar assembly
VLTVWSSKGGSGKSMTAMELAYLLANVGGRKVLLVDGDMNRGYVAVALGQDAMAFARQKNIATLATLYHNRAQMPNLESFVYNYPPAFGKGGRGNLDILFGLASPDQANLPCFVGDEGQQGMHFVSALRDMAQKSYEFLIFDIGTLIPVHVHAAAIKEATTLLVVSTPIVPDIQPTKAGLEQMKKYDLLPRNASEKAVLVMNHYHEDCGFQENEFPAFIGLTMVAAFPQVVPEPLMYAIVNQGQFVSEHFLGSKNGDALKGLTRQLLGLAEYFAPGTRGLARQHAPKLADVVETDRRGIFKRKRA